MGMETESAPDAAGRRNAVLTRVAIGAGALIALILLGRQIGATVPRFAEWVDGLGVWGPVVFILGYVAAVVAFAPGALLTLAAGAIFGLVEGVAYVFIAALLGSGAAFLVARYLARATIERRLQSNPRFAAIDRAVGNEGRKIVFLLRLSPAFPFNLLNYALGLTNVRFVDYMIGGFGMLPGTFLYVYYGRVIGSVAAIAGGESAGGGTAQNVLLVVGLVATIAVTTIVTRIARRALKSEVAAG
jgi:uncharacterized membrane protein YdjX (TVP38/TMEM64 family)